MLQSIFAIKRCNQLFAINFWLFSQFKKQLYLNSFETTKLLIAYHDLEMKRPSNIQNSIKVSMVQVKTNWDISAWGKRWRSNGWWRRNRGCVRTSAMTARRSGRSLDMRIHQVAPKIYHTYSKNWVNRDWVIHFLGFFWWFLRSAARFT